MSLLLVIVLVLAAVLIVRIAAGSRHKTVGNDIIVRCRQGHLFTTIWIPGVSVKARRLGAVRSQWCPVGRHWTTVTRVPESELTADAIEDAREHHDIRVP